MSSIALSVFVSAASAVCSIGPTETSSAVVSAWQPVNEELEELYRSGIAFDEFYADARRRRELWVNNYGGGIVAEEMVDRVEALGGKWRLLAIAEDWCSDSVNTIPYLALLAERASNLEIRILDSEQGRSVMEAHRTPDDRAATPTVLILDSEYENVGCFVERPADLQAWALEERPKLRDTEFLQRKMQWYTDDAGGSTVREIVEGLEAAAQGGRVCSSG